MVVLNRKRTGLIVNMGWAGAREILERERDRGKERERERERERDGEID